MKKMVLIKLTLVAITFFGFAGVPVYADTIVVPTDYPTIHFK